MIPKDSSYPVGVYSITPIVGRIVDARGPRYVLVAACLLLLVGYSVIRAIYDNGAPSSGSISIFTFGLLVFSSFMTGAGGSGGLTSSINATVKSFPERAVSQTVYLVFLLAFIAQYRELLPQGSSYQVLVCPHSSSRPSHTPYFAATHPPSCYS